MALTRNALIVIIVIVLIVSLGANIYYATKSDYVSTTTSTRIVTTSIQVVTSTTASRTTPCGTVGAACGNFTISSGSLEINGSTSTLQATLLNTGSDLITSATVYINNTLIGNPAPSTSSGNTILNLTSGEQTELVMIIPNATIPIQVGKLYVVLVNAWVQTPGGARANMARSLNIVAASTISMPVVTVTTNGSSTSAS